MKKVILLFIVFLFTCNLVCSCGKASSDTQAFSELKNNISYSAYEMALTQEDILSILLRTMQDNDKEVYFCVPNENLIDADLWITKLNGIEQIHCEYRPIREGINVAVTLSYWDNYSVVNAHNTGNTSRLTDRQLELYYKYCSIIAQYTSSDQSDYEKELAIHNYLVTHTDYVENGDAIYNAYDTLINHTGVCSGYAECFKTFMDMLDIPCIAISGTANDVLHIWDLVELDNEWYHVDVTWDDPINSDGDIDYTYFNINDDEITVDHNWDSTIYPVASAIKYSYIQMSHMPQIFSSSELLTLLTTLINQQENTMEFVAYTKIDISDICDNINKNISFSYKMCERPLYTVYKIHFVYQ